MSLRAAALLVVLALAAGGCALLPGDGTYQVQAEFSRTYNLFVGSPVRVLGLNVGRVVDVQVDPGDTAVTVTMQIDDATTLPADAEAVIIPEALLGERYVQFEPAYDGTGAILEAGATIPVERTAVPAEFDEVLSSLNDFVRGLDPDDVGAFVGNLADTLEGNGEQLGRTIERAAEAISVLRDNDEQLLSLADRLADLNDTIASRDQAIGRLIEQWNTVTASLADDREQIDAALGSLLRVVRQLGEVVITHRRDLQRDIATVTRIGRTVNRNLDNVSLTVLSSAELFRNFDRIVDRERNWLPLVNHVDPDALSRQIAESLGRRLEGLCLRLLPDRPDECDQLPLDDVLAGGQLCLPGLIPCATADGGTRVPVSEALEDTLERSPALRDALEDRASGEPDGLSGLTDDLLGGSADAGGRDEPVGGSTGDGLPGGGS